MPEKNETDIVWYGRGGQGAFTAARIIAASFALTTDGYAMAFPSFGPERRGAPVRAFTKLSSTPICNRSQCREPDFSVYLDGGLFDMKPPETGIAIVNTKEDPRLERVIPFDATGLAEEILGRPITNTAMAGALASFISELTLGSLETGIETCMPPKLREKNLKIMTQAYIATRQEHDLTKAHRSYPRMEGRPSA